MPRRPRYSPIKQQQQAEQPPAQQPPAPRPAGRNLIYQQKTPVRPYRAPTRSADSIRAYSQRVGQGIEANAPPYMWYDRPAASYTPRQVARYYRKSLTPAAPAGLPAQQFEAAYNYFETNYPGQDWTTFTAQDVARDPTAQWLLQSLPTMTPDWGDPDDYASMEKLYGALDGYTDPITAQFGLEKLTEEQLAQAPKWQQFMIDAQSNPVVAGASQMAPFAVLALTAGAIAGGPAGAAAAAPGAAGILATGAGLGWLGDPNNAVLNELDKYDPQIGKTARVGVENVFIFLNYLSEQLESAVGVGAQVAGSAIDPDKYGAFKELQAHFAEAWGAGRNMYNTIPADVGNWLTELEMQATGSEYRLAGPGEAWVLGYSAEPVAMNHKEDMLEALADARQEIIKRVEGGQGLEEAIREVEFDRRVRYGWTGDVWEFIGQSLLDPLEWVPVYARKGMGEYGKLTGNKALQMAAEISRQGPFDTLKVYLELLRSGVAGLTTAEIANMGPLTRFLGGVTKEGEVKTLTQARIPFVSMTPEGRAFEVLGITKDNAGLLLSQKMDDPVAMVERFDKWTTTPLDAAEDYGMKHLAAPYGSVAAVALRDAKPFVHDLLKTWTDTAPVRVMLDTTAKALGMTQAELKKLIRAAKPEELDALARQLVDKARTTNDAGARALIAAYEAGTFGADQLKRVQDVVVKGNIPTTTQAFYAELMGGIISQTEKWAVKQFGVKPNSWFYRSAELVKAAQSLIFLGLNPRYLVNNFINGEITMAFEGVGGWAGTADEIKDFWSRWGVEPMRLKAGYGFGALGEELDISPQAPVGAEIRKAATQPGAIQDMVDAVKDLGGKIAIFSKYSQDIERWQSQRAMTKGTKHAWRVLWRRGKGFTEMPAALAARLAAIDPRMPDVIHSIIEAGIAPDEITGRIFGNVLRHDVDRYIDSVARDVGMDGDQARRLLDHMGLYDSLNSGLATAKTRDEIEAVFNQVDKRARDWLDQQVTEEVSARAEEAAARVVAAGSTGDKAGAFREVVGLLDEVDLQVMSRWNEQSITFAEVFDRASKTTTKKRKNALMANAFNEQMDVWATLRKFEENTTTGIVEGLRKAGIKFPSGFLKSLKEGGEVWRDFFTYRNEMYRKFFGEDGNTSGYADFDELEAHLSERYQDAFDRAAALREAMDRAVVKLAEQQGGAGLSEQLIQYREHVADVRRAMADQVSEFRRSIRGADGNTRRYQWFWFNNTVLGPLMEQFYAAKIGERQALSGMQPAELPKWKRTPAPGKYIQEFETMLKEHGLGNFGKVIREIGEINDYLPEGAERFTIKEIQEIPSRERFKVLDETLALWEAAKAGKNQRLESAEATGRRVAAERAAAEQAERIAPEPAPVAEPVTAVTPEPALSADARIRQNAELRAYVDELLAKHLTTIGELRDDLELAKRLQLSAEEKIEWLKTDHKVTGLRIYDRDQAFIDSKPYKLLFDVSGMKTLNDRFGHAAGDALLAGTARALSENGYPDAQRKFGEGDEFIIGFDDEPGARAAMETVSKIIYDAIIYVKDESGQEHWYTHANIYPGVGTTVEAADYESTRFKQEYKAAGGEPTITEIGRPGDGDIANGPELPEDQGPTPTSGGEGGEPGGVGPGAGTPGPAAGSTPAAGARARVGGPLAWDTELASLYSKFYNPGEGIPHDIPALRDFRLELDYLGQRYLAEWGDLPRTFTDLVSLTNSILKQYETRRQAIKGAQATLPFIPRLGELGEVGRLTSPVGKFVWDGGELDGKTVWFDGAVLHAESPLIDQADWIDTKPNDIWRKETEFEKQLWVTKIEYSDVVEGAQYVRVTDEGGRQEWLDVRRYAMADWWAPDTVLSITPGLKGLHPAVCIWRGDQLVGAVMPVVAGKDYSSKFKYWDTGYTFDGIPNRIGAYVRVRRGKHTDKFGQIIGVVEGKTNLYQVELDDGQRAKIGLLDIEFSADNAGVGVVHNAAQADAWGKWIETVREGDRVAVEFAEQGVQQGTLRRWMATWPHGFMQAWVDFDGGMSQAVARGSLRPIEPEMPDAMSPVIEAARAEAGALAEVERVADNGGDITPPEAASAPAFVQPTTGYTGFPLERLPDDYKSDVGALVNSGPERILARMLSGRYPLHLTQSSYGWELGRKGKPPLVSVQDNGISRQEAMIVLWDRLGGDYSNSVLWRDFFAELHKTIDSIVPGDGGDYRLARYQINYLRHGLPEGDRGLLQRFWDDFNTGQTRLKAGITSARKKLLPAELENTRAGLHRSLDDLWNKYFIEAEPEAVEPPADTAGISEAPSETAELARSEPDAEAVQKPVVVLPSKQQTGSAAKNIAKLLEQLGLTDKEIRQDNWYYHVDNPPYTRLTIESQPSPLGDGDVLIFTHYLKDAANELYLDSEMIYQVWPDGTLHLLETAVHNPIRGGESRGKDASFANLFARNLVAQGFGEGTLIDEHAGAPPEAPVGSRNAGGGEVGPAFDLRYLSLDEIDTIEGLYRGDETLLGGAKNNNLDNFILFSTKRISSAISEQFSRYAGEPDSEAGKVWWDLYRRIYDQGAERQQAILEGLATRYYEWANRQSADLFEWRRGLKYGDQVYAGEGEYRVEATIEENNPKGPDVMLRIGGVRRNGVLSNIFPMEGGGETAALPPGEAITPAETGTPTKPEDYITVDPGQVIRPGETKSQALLRAMEDQFMPGGMWDDTRLFIKQQQFEKWAETVLGEHFDIENERDVNLLYDTMEGLLNKALRTVRTGFDAEQTPLAKRLEVLQEWESRMMKARRTLLKKEFQQFSTPVTISEAAGVAADVRPGDVVGEATAGTANLVDRFYDRGDVVVRVNEIDPGRRDVLEAIGYSPTGIDVLKVDWFMEGGKRRKPWANVHIMNPPWGAYSKGIYGSPTDVPVRGLNDWSQRFYYLITQQAPEGSRVVIVAPTNWVYTKSRTSGLITPAGGAFRQWLESKYWVRAIIESPPGAYDQRATGVGSLLVVVDHLKKPDLAGPALEAWGDNAPKTWTEYAALVEQLQTKYKRAKGTVEDGQNAAREQVNTDIERARSADAAGNIVAGRTGGQEPGESGGSGQPITAPITPPGGVSEGEAAAVPGAGSVGELPGGLAGVPGPLPNEIPGGAGAGITTGVAGGQESGSRVQPGAGADRGEGLPTASVVAEGTKRPRVRQRAPVGVVPASGTKIAAERTQPYRESATEAVRSSQGFALSTFEPGDELSPHPRPLVEASSLAGVEAPDVGNVKIHPDIWDANARGALSDDQRHAIERIAWAVEHHHGIVIADGTGVGKAREVMATAMDWMGRGVADKILILTKKDKNVLDLIEEGKIIAAGGYDDTGKYKNSSGDKFVSPTTGEEYRLVWIRDYQPGQIPVFEKAIYLGEYTQMKRHEQQLHGLGLNGFIADEAHEAKNLWGKTGGIGKQQGSKVAETWSALHDTITQNRGVFAYFTATPAEDVPQLAYLWGLREWESGKASFNAWLQLISGQINLGDYMRTLVSARIAPFRQVELSRLESRAEVKPRIQGRSQGSWNTFDVTPIGPGQYGYRKDRRSYQIFTIDSSNAGYGYDGIVAQVAEVMREQDAIAMAQYLTETEGQGFIYDRIEAFKVLGQQEAINDGAVDMDAIEAAQHQAPSERADTSAVAFSPAFIEQVMRELKTRGKFISRELWRGGLEYDMKEAATSAAFFDTPEYAELVGVFKHIEEAYKRWGKRSGAFKAKRSLGPNGPIQNFVRQLIGTVIIHDAMRAADEYIAEGMRPVISLNYIGEIDPTRGNLGAAVNEVANTTRERLLDEKGNPLRDPNGTPMLGAEIPEAMLELMQIEDEVKAVTSKIMQYMYKDIPNGQKYIGENIFPSPLQLLVDKYGRDNLSLIVGDAEDVYVHGQKIRKPDKAVENDRFQQGLTKLAVISAAGGTGISLHDKYGNGRRVLLFVDYDWTATEIMQRLGRIDRADNQTSPLVNFLTLPQAIHRKMLSTVAARMNSTGAVSRGGSNAVGASDFSESMDLSSEYYGYALRAAWGDFPDEIKHAVGWINDDGSLPHSFPEGKTVKDFMLRLQQFMVPKDSDAAFDLWMQKVDELKTSREYARHLERLTARMDGDVLRETRLKREDNFPLNLFEVKDKEGHLFGVLSGVFLDQLLTVREIIAGGRTGELLGVKWIAVQDRNTGQVVSGIRIPPNALERLANEFQATLKRQVTPENALATIESGNKVRVQGPNNTELVIRQRKDGHIVLDGAKAAMEKTLAAYGMQRHARGFYFLGPEDVEKFVRAFPIIQDVGAVEQFKPYYAYSGGKFVQVDALEEVRVEHLPGAEFFIRMDQERGEQTFYLIEARTGLSIAYGESLEAAKEAGLKALSNYNEDRFKQLIADSIRRYGGESPRYKDASGEQAMGSSNIPMWGRKDLVDEHAAFLEDAPLDGVKAVAVTPFEQNGVTIVGSVYANQKLVAFLPDGYNNQGVLKPFDTERGPAQILGVDTEDGSKWVVRWEDGYISTMPMIKGGSDAARSTTTAEPARPADAPAYRYLGMAQQELYHDQVRPLLERLKEKATGSEAGLPESKLGRMDGETTRALEKYVNQVSGQMADSKLAAMKIGEMRRDAALINYSQRYGWDNVATAIFPYELFYTRSMLNWAVRVLDNPAILAMWARLRRFQNSIDREGFPTRLKNKIKVPLPFMPEWAGDGVWIDPFKQIFPFEMFFMPFNAAQDTQNQIIKRTQSTLQRWAQEGRIESGEALAAMSAQSGPTWERALAAAQNEVEGADDPMAFMDLVMAPSYPLGIALKYAQGKQNEIEPLPITRDVQAITGAAGLNQGVGLNLEGPARRALNLPEYGRWGDYRIDRQLSNMAAEGIITADQAQIAMIERAGMIFDMAKKRAAQEGQISTFGSYVGMPANLLPPGEMEQRGLAGRFSEAMLADSMGNSDALAKFFDDYPEYEARLALYDEPPERLRQFLISQVWDQYFNLPDLYQRQAREELGRNFREAFLQTETRSYDAINTQTLATWAQALGGYATNKTEPADLGIEWAPAEAAAGYQAYANEKAARFPNVGALQDMYFNLAPDQRAQFVKANPELQAYWNWKDRFLAENPGMIQYMPKSKNDPLDGAPVETQMMVYWFRAMRAENFPNIFDRQSEYYDLPAGAQRKAYLLEHPELESYWSWRRGMLTQYPDMIPYVMSAESIAEGLGYTNTSSSGGSSYSTSGSRSSGYSGGSSGGGYSYSGGGGGSSGQKPLEYLSPRQMYLFNPALIRQLYEYYYGGETLGSGAAAELRRLWVVFGEPGGNFDVWVEEAVRASFK